MVSQLARSAAGICRASCTAGCATSTCLNERFRASQPCSCIHPLAAVAALLARYTLQQEHIYQTLCHTEAGTSGRPAPASSGMRTSS